MADTRRQVGTMQTTRSGSSWVVRDSKDCLVRIGSYYSFETPKELAQEARLRGFEVDKDGTVWLDV